MSRQSFRGAGGAGAVVVPYADRLSSAGEYELSATIQPVLADGRRRLEGALARVASGVLAAVAAFVVAWTLGS